MPCILDSDDANSIQVKKDSKVVLNSDENQKMSGETPENGIEIKNGENGHEDSLEQEENLETSNGEVKTESEEAKTNAENPEDIPLKIFTIKLMIPGAGEPSTLQISNHDTVQEIRQVVLDRPESCFRTCFSLQLNGNRLDDFVELHTVEDMKEDAVVKVVDEPYSVREARIHIRRLRDLLSTSLYQSSFSATDNLSLSLCTTIAGVDPEDEILKGSKDSNLPTEDCTPPGCSVLEETGSVPELEPLIPESNQPKAQQCLKDLRYSSWNPPPGPRKLAGDLLYLDVVTLEENKYSITASSNGFYINRTTDVEFDPKPHNEPCRAQTLVGLLSQVSPLFKKNFSALQRQSVKKHPLEVVPCPYQVYPWISPLFEHVSDPFRAEDAVTGRIGYEEQIPGQLRDWNEELQSAKELPRKSTHQRILRDRALYKITSDFVAAATKGAVAVVDGNVMAINPGEDEKLRMYIWNNIFFSFACDSRDHYRRFGGDAAAYAAAGGDLGGVVAFNRLDIEGLYTLGTVIIDYRGYRVIAQSIIPGILQREQENSVVYGSIDGGKSLSGNEKFLELLKKAGETLRTRPHKVCSEKGEEVELCSSMECKGIIGADGRHYILDLFRTFPPDTNFIQAAKENAEKCPNDTEKVEKSEEEDVKQEPVSEQENEEQISTNGKLEEDGQKDAAAGKEEGKEKKEDGEMNKSNEEQTNTESTTPKDEQKKFTFEFPAQYSHELCTLRQNLVDAFVGFRYVLFLKLIAIYSQQLRAIKDKKEKEALSNGDTEETKEAKAAEGAEAAIENESEEIKKIDPKEIENTQQLEIRNAEDLEKLGEELTKEAKDLEEAKKLEQKERDEIAMQAVKAAAATIGSLSDKEFDIKFNPDVFVAEVKHAESEKNNLEKDKVLAKDASKFLSETVVPKLVEDFITLTIVPLDGLALTEAMHARGINMRYLGKVASLCALREDLQHVHRIAVSEMILRAAKKQIKSCLQSGTLRTLSAAVCHFLNCFLSAFPTPQPHLPPEETIKKKKNKKKGKTAHSSNNQIAWVNLTPSILWKEIRDEIVNHFGFKLESGEPEDVLESYKIHKLSLLRGLCRKSGVQLLLRNYDMDNKKHPAFSEEDILNIFPVVKHVEPQGNDGNALFEVAQAKLQAGLFGEAHDLMLESLNIFNQVYGPLHGDIAVCYRTIARLHYLADDVPQAVSYQRKAVVVCERIYGIDHPETINSYVHLALYCYTGGLVNASLKLMYRARYLALLVYGEGHPDLATFDTNIGLMLHSQREFDLSLKFLERALNVHLKYYGAESLQTGTVFHLVARAQCCIGDYRAAVTSEKATYNVYKKLFGEENARTKESSEFLNQTTHRAVKMQKTINEISGKSGGRSITPPKSSVTKVPEESYDKEILGVINKIGAAPEATPVKSKQDAS
ncbi:clustered mitochondria protein homolog [Rhopilema esculentum]|uniref:clustered mitochondria protein homolog n=1 Tax=Rhopilema esculentum TaxID=499914 RepID=UPI0031D9EA43|eukprot:gene15508-6770_t